VHLVGFIIRIYLDARSPERQTDINTFVLCAICKHSVIFDKSSVTTTLTVSRSMTFQKPVIMYRQFAN